MDTQGLIIFFIILMKPGNVLPCYKFLFALIIELSHRLLWPMFYRFFFVFDNQRTAVI